MAEDTAELETQNAATAPTIDGMPVGEETHLPIEASDIILSDDPEVDAALKDPAAATLVWEDYRRAAEYVTRNSWLLEWQYIDYLYQSPSYDYDATTTTARPSRIPRFNVAKNTNTMKTQVRRAIFSDPNWFLLTPRGETAGMDDQEDYLTAWTELLLELCDRADLGYQFGRQFIFSQCLQGTGIGIPLWEQRKVTRKRRVQKKPPVAVDMPVGQETVDTEESDEFDLVPETTVESWPSFEFRRLGTTLYSEKWRHPGRPDLSGFPRIDVDYVTLEDLRELRELEAYKNIPEDEPLLRYFVANAASDAEAGTSVDQNLSQNSGFLMHAAQESDQTSPNPLTKPLMKIARWTATNVQEILVYSGRKLVIRNEEHDLGEENAAGYTANWFDVENAGYGYGIGRLNAGDQRMTQGVLAAALKMIAYPTNAPILYDKTAGDAPTQNLITELGTFLGVSTRDAQDIFKSIGFMQMPEVPAAAMQIYELAKTDAEEIVGADQTTMQGQLGGPGSSFGRTAAGANRLSAKADEAIMDQVDALERVLESFLGFLRKMVIERMGLKEIRTILSKRMAAAITKKLDGQKFVDCEFDFKILCGSKLAAKAQIAQLIPFLLQLLQQPQLLDYLHQKGDTVNFLAIERLFMRVAEIAGEESIIVPLTPQQRQMVMQMQPNQIKQQGDTQVQQLKNQGKIADTQAKQSGELTRDLIDKEFERETGAAPLELAAGRVARNADMNILENGLEQ